ncbi:cache domain-containing sensor histidine kinase [Alkalicoccobacillus porphyridii]|nr:sensor histidine kinase [Alkalicoccobacillus porphyridii]
MALRQKIIVLFLCIVLIPLNVLGMVTYYYFSKTLEDQTYRFTVQIIDQVNQNVNAYIEEMHRLSLLPLYDREVLAILQDHEDPTHYTFPKTDELERMSSFLSTLSYNRQELSGIHIMANDGSLFGNLGSPRSVHRMTNDVKDEWHQTLMVGDGRSLLLPTHNPSYLLAETDVFSVGRVIRDPESFNHLGMIKIDIQLTFIESLLEDVSLSEDPSISIIDNQGNLFFEKGKPVYRMLQNEGYIISDFVERESVVADGIAYLPVIRETPGGEVQTIVFLPEHKIFGASQSLRMFTLGLMAAATVLIIMLGLLAERRLTKPIFELRHHMALAEKGEFNHRIKTYSKDELGQLSVSFNHMMEQINELIARVYRTEIREKEAEIKALQSQMNPHFIYNTLEHINMMAITKREYEISDMVASLGKLIRYSIDQKTRFVPLKDELAFVESYVSIQQKRLEGQLTFSISVPEKLLTIKIPKLTIQPLLENAIEHGHIHGGIKGDICIKGWQEDGKCYIQVADSGQGMELEQLQRIRTKQQQFHDGNRIALANIAERLNLLLGEPYGLTVESERGVGTKVTICIPITL